MNELQIFKNEKFGEIRVTIKNGEPWFVVNDACRILEISNPRDALARLDDDEKDDVGLTDAIGRIQKTNVVNEPGLYSLVLGSRKPEAKEFKRWLTHEVIPSIRKTGTYSINPAPKEDAQLARAKAMLLNARTRAANAWIKLGASFGTPESKQVAHTYAANTLAGKEILALPKVERKSFTATEIGNMFKVSSQMIGRLANANGLKTPEYAIQVWDKAKHSNKQVPTWRYYENAIPVFAKLLGKEVA